MPEHEAAITSLSTLEKAVLDVCGEFDGEAAWWRGQANFDWTLKPGGFRDQHGAGKYTPAALIGNFKIRALGRLGHRPVPSTDLEWLFLAQHYGLPTQLLDWTENPLFALFFAVSQQLDTDSDACLWALSPTKLNVEHANPGNLGSGQRGLINLDERPVQAVVMQAVGFKDESIRRRIFPEATVLPEMPKSIALASVEIDERIVAQSGRFTLHSCNGAVDGLSGNDKFLRKFRIPGREKERIRMLLQLMGIHRWNLFPDIGSLASELKNWNFVKS
jgi:hypothetical protein